MYAKREIRIFQEPWSFFGVNFNWQFQQNFAFGNGTTGQQTGSITAITQAVNAQVTSTNHGLATGDIVTITLVLGMVEVNNLSYTITVVDANNFLLNVDSTGFTPYISGGIWTGIGFYSGTLTSVPIIRSQNNNPAVITPLNPISPFPAGVPVPFPQTNISRVQNLLITADINNGTTLHVSDDGGGNLIGDCISGTIDYDTGLITNLVFTSAIPQGANIQAQYNPVTLSIPLSILFFQNQFTLRPVPDKGYTIEMIAYRLPSQVLLGSNDPLNPVVTGVPESREWWETLAFGAAKKIYEDRLDPDGVTLMEKSLNERYLLNETRTYAQLGKRSIATLYSDQLNYNYGTGGIGFQQGVV